jgi:lipid-binding SYLF domain-containing protein
MKKLFVALLILDVAWAAMAIDQRLDEKAQKLLVKFEVLQAKSDKRVPPEVLRRARGIILLDRTKAGFIFAYQGGSGVAMVKDKKGKWGPLAWVKADEASLGAQIGGQQSFFVFLLMSEESAKTLIADAAFELGAEARGTGGASSAGVAAKTDSIDRKVLVYDDRQGLFAGAAVSGGAVSADYRANRKYYGEELNMQEILFDKKVKPTETATALARKLEEYGKPH